MNAHILIVKMFQKANYNLLNKMPKYSLKLGNQLIMEITMINLKLFIKFP